jgi:hypothetical protein
MVRRQLANVLLVMVKGSERGRIKLVTKDGALVTLGPVFHAVTKVNPNPSFFKATFDGKCEDVIAAR